MIINNDLRNEVYINNLLHGLWDNRRNFYQLCINISGEIEEVESELAKYSDPKYVYYNHDNPNKPEGVPTELSDIIIFILDYFGDCYIPPEAIDIEKPDTLPIPIEIEPKYLEFPTPKLDEFLDTMAASYVTFSKGSPEYDEEFKTVRAMLTPSFVFSSLKKDINEAMSKAQTYDLYQRVGVPYNVPNIEETQTVKYQLHKIIRIVLEFCHLYGIDIDAELRRKIDYNNSRPEKHRQIGESNPLETDNVKVNSELIKIPGALRMASDIIAHRETENANMDYRRKLSVRLKEIWKVNGRKIK